MVHRLATRTCLYGDCDEPVLTEMPYGFTMCHAHASAARRIIPLPAGFTPHPQIDPYPEADPPKRPTAPLSMPKHAKLRARLIALLTAYTRVADKWIAAETGLSTATVGRVRRQLEKDGQLEHVPYYRRVKTPADLDSKALMIYPEETLTRLMQGKPVSKAAVHELELDGYITTTNGIRPTAAGHRILNLKEQQ
ncbi:hypothetical protein [Corynebacterium dentalis]|uniref:hypothetical protein n=1 Tax=Corynebacterium dentalis TaxID=2014528 RepID=UPI0028990878|nr:hypothetical protein [Corynebacterium dentalis]